MRAKYALDDIKFKLLDPHFLNLSNLEAEKRLDVMSTYNINRDDIIKTIKSHHELLSSLNNMIYTMERISAENSNRIELANKILAKLKIEKIKLH